MRPSGSRPGRSPRSTSRPASGAGTGPYEGDGAAEASLITSGGFEGMMISLPIPILSQFLTVSLLAAHSSCERQAEPAGDLRHRVARLHDVDLRRRGGRQGHHRTRARDALGRARAWHSPGRLPTPTDAEERRQEEEAQRGDRQCDGEHEHARHRRQADPGPDGRIRLGAAGVLPGRAGDDVARRRACRTDARAVGRVAVGAGSRGPAVRRRGPERRDPRAPRRAPRPC